MLLDFEELLEEDGKDRRKYEKATGRDLSVMMPKFLALLMRHQYLYTRDRGIDKAVRILDYPSLRRFVENYFETAGYALEYDETDMWVGLFPLDEIRIRTITPTLPKDLTILLLLCANIYAKDQQDVQLDKYGCATPYVDEVFDEYQTIVGQGAPSSFRKQFENNVNELKAKNILSYAKGLNSDDDQLIIRPMILRVVGPEYQARLDAWLESWVEEEDRAHSEREDQDLNKGLADVHA
jgi:hypothetical protein